MQNSVRSLGLVVSLAFSVGLLTLPAAANDGRGGAPALPPGLARALAEDSSLHVARDGAVFVRDEWTMSATAASDASPGPARLQAAGAATTSDPFTLHSRPTATRTIFLDFDGGSLPGDNSWRTSGGLSGSRVEPIIDATGSLVYRGWSLDGSAAFSSTERGVIQEVWARVAEDFAPFDVDVTTQQPAAGGLFRSSSTDMTYGTRVAFTAGTVQQALCPTGCGGIAWIGTFDDVTRTEVRDPAWVFPALISNRAKYMADAAAHEAGHTLGLTHDSEVGKPYSPGSSLWGPIMGAPYRSRVTQWSRGDYPGATNHEDDLATITATGLSYRADEAGQTAATAGTLSSAGTAAGVVSGNGDQDWYAVDDCTGTLTATATPAGLGADLDIRLQLRDAAGAVLATNAPLTTAIGSGDMGASLSLPRTGGPYYLAVSGGGSGAGGASAWMSGGYDGYGSLGAYRLTMGGCSGLASLPSPVTRPSAPPRPRVVRGRFGGPLTVGVHWARPGRTGGATITGYRLTAYRFGQRGRVVARRSLHTTASRRAASLRLARGSWVVKVQARNRAGWGPLSRRSAKVSPR